MAEILMAKISSELSQFSNVAPDVTCPKYMNDFNDILILNSEMIPLSDPRAHSPAFAEAKKAEMRGLLQRGIFKVILREEVPADATIMKGPYVLVSK